MHIEAKITAAARKNPVRAVAVAGTSLVAGLGVGFGFVAVAKAIDIDPAISAAVVATGVAGFAAVSSLRWWRKLTEAQRQMHKRAWWWGGSIGLTVGCALLLTILMGVRHLDMLPAALLGPTPIDGVIRAMFAIVLCQVVGYGIACGVAQLADRTRSAA